MPPDYVKLSSNFTCLCLNIFRVISSSLYWNLQSKTCVKIHYREKKTLCNPSSLMLQVDRALRETWMKGGYQNSLEGIYWHHSECNTGKGLHVNKKERSSTAPLCNTNLRKVWLSWWVSQTDCYRTDTNHKFPGMHQCPKRKALLQRIKTSLREIEAKSESKTTKTVTGNSLR